MSAYHSAKSSSSAGSLVDHEPVIRSACMAFEEAVASRLSDSYAAAETLNGEHGAAVTATINLTAGLMLAIAKLGETIGTSATSVEDFVNAVTDVVLSEHSMNVALYNPAAEIAKLFEDKDDTKSNQIKSEILKKMETSSAPVDDERKLQEAKELIKKLETEYQEKVDDLVNVAKYGHSLGKNSDYDKITEADVARFRKDLERIFQEKHLLAISSSNPATGAPQTKLSTGRTMFFSLSAADKDAPQSPALDVKRIKSPSDDDSTGSRSPQGFGCCGAFSKKRKSKRRPVLK